MPNVLVRSYNVKKGISYDGLVPQGNGFWITEKVKISVNRSPFTNHEPYQVILTRPDYTYSFEKDTNIMLLNVANNGVNPFYSAESHANIDIASNTESAALVTLVAPQAGTECTITARFFFDNSTNNSKADVTIRLKKDGTQIATHTSEVAKKQSGVVGVEIQGVTVVAGENYTITCESNKDGEIDGSEISSIIQYEIRTL